MIKFFRKIRQNLLSEGKTGKYFKYAFGEIILVVIGILIALQINNWNQTRINRTIEIETLENLRQDLGSALTQLDIKIEQNYSNRTSDSIALTIIHRNTVVPKDSIIKLLLSHIFTPTFDPELGTLTEILSTGKMEIIRSEPLRNHISSWNKYMDELDEVDNRLIYLDDNIKTPLYSKYLPYRNSLNYVINPNTNDVLKIGFGESNFQTDIESFIYNLEVENMLSNYYLYGTVQEIRLNDVKNKMTDMIALIDKELKTVN